MKAVLTHILVLCLFLNMYEAFVKTERAARVKRQKNPGDALIDAVFQIPIQTLSAVGTLVKTSRPIIMQVRQRVQQSIQQTFQQSLGTRQPQRFSFSGSSSKQQMQQLASNRISMAVSHNQLPNANYNKLYKQVKQPHQPSNHQASGGGNRYLFRYKRRV